MIKSILKVKIISLFLLIGNFCALGQLNLKELSNPDNAGLSNDSLKKMNASFHKLVDDNQLAGIQTAIIREGKLIHFDSYGYADIGGKAPLSDQSIFRIFSMTKPIVSVALMQLYEQGKFKLEDPLHQFIPEFRETFIFKDSGLVRSRRPIRIIDLLRHTSGYNYGNTRNTSLNRHYARANLYSSVNNEEFVKRLSKVPLQFEPGTNWQYGLSTNICGYLIEVLTGQSLQDYLNNFVLKPLKMMDTHFQLPKHKISRFTSGYRWDRNSGLHESESAENNRYVDEVTVFNGGGGLVSTTFDYLTFCQMLLNKGVLDGKRILKESTIDLMFSDHLEEVRKHQTERIRLPLGEASFGLGFAIRGENIDSLEGVFGWGGAAGTYFKVDMEHKLAYVMMIQIIPYRHLGLRRKIQQFIDSAIIE